MAWVWKSRQRYRLRTSSLQLDSSSPQRLVEIPQTSAPPESVHSAIARSLSLTSSAFPKGPMITPSTPELSIKSVIYAKGYKCTRWQVLSSRIIYIHAVRAAKHFYHASITCFSILAVIAAPRLSIPQKLAPLRRLSALMIFSNHCHHPNLSILFIF